MKATRERDNREFTQQSTSVNMNAGVECRHQLLSTEWKDRCFVPASVWERFVLFYPASAKYTRHDSPCPECMKMDDTKEQNEELWARQHKHDKATLKGRLPLLIPRASSAVITSQVLLPGEWAKAFKLHMEGKAKVIPPKLNMGDLLCTHGLLRYNPVPLEWKPYEARSPPYDLPGTREGDLAVCDQALWNSLTKDGTYLAGATDPVRMLVKEMHPGPNQIYDLGDWDRWRVTTVPEPCPECVQQRTREAQVSASEWPVSEFVVHVMEPGAALPAAVSAPSAGGPAASSRPKRAAARKAKGTADIMQDVQLDDFSSQDTLQKLKLTLYQFTDVPPGQQEIFFEGRMLKGDAATLAELGVPYTAELWLVRNLDGDADTSHFFGDDAAGGAAGRPRAKPAAREAGFAGTALSSAARPRPAAAVAPTAAAAAAAFSAPPAVSSPADAKMVMDTTWACGR